MHRALRWTVAVLLLGVFAHFAPAQNAAVRILEIKVVDRENNPIEGVALKLSGSAGGRPLNDSRNTDPGGTASLIIGTSAPADYLHITARKKGLVNKRLMWRKGGDLKDSVPTSYTMTMEPGVKISGSVVDDAGKPVDGATVVLAVRSKEREAVETYDVSYQSVKADAAGKWSYPMAPKNMDAISIGGWHHDCDITQGYFPMNDFEPIAALFDGSAKVTLTRGQKVEGVVYGADGNPLAKAEVGVGSDRVASNIVPPVRTDAQGRFSFGAKLGAPVVLTVKAPNHAPQLRQFAMGNESKTVEVHLKPGKTLHGSVVDSEGKPLAGVRLFVDTWRGHRTIVTNFSTDKSGKFSWNGAPDDEVQLDVMKAGYADARKQKVRAGDEPVTITLRSPLRVTGEVVDAETGKPVENFSVIQGIVFNDQQTHWQRDMSRVKPRPGGKFEFEQTFPYPGYALRIEAEGYLPSTSRIYKLEEGKVDLKFAMKKGEGITAIVTTPDGKPASQADVLLALKGANVRISNGQRDQHDRDSIATKTDANGKFVLPPQEDAYVLAILHDSGQARLTAEEFSAAKGAIKLTPWAKVEGVVKIGDKIGAGERVNLWMQEPFEQNAPRIYISYDKTADEKGHFAFDRVFPGKVGASRYIQLGPQTWGSASTTPLTVEPGKTAVVQIGGKGRAVVGRIVVPPQAGNWNAQHGSLTSDIAMPKMPRPDDWATMSAEQRKAWYENWSKSDEGKSYQAKVHEASEQRRHYSVPVADGSFRVDDVEPGKYKLNIPIGKADQASRGGWSQPIGSASADVEVVAGPAGDALDVGSIEVKLIQRVDVGQLAPTFTTKTVDGKELKLEDYRGKYVLLDFWATWCGPCIAELPHLKAAHEAFANDERFVMISLSLDEDPSEPRKFAQANGMTWPQAFLGEWSKDTVTKAYGVQGIPSVWLIDPEGKVIAKSLRGDQVKEELTRALKGG